MILGSLVSYICYLNEASTRICNYTFLKAMNLLVGMLTGSHAYFFICTGYYAFIDFISLPTDKPKYFALSFMLLQFN